MCPLTTLSLLLILISNLSKRHGFELKGDRIYASSMVIKLLVGVVACRNVMRSYNVLFSSNSHPLGSNNISSSSRGGSRSTTAAAAAAAAHGATTSEGMVPLMGISDRELRDDATNNDATISEKLLTTLQQEVEQVTAALAAHWKVVQDLNKKLKFFVH
jgi:hypothetical protein